MILYCVWINGALCSICPAPAQIGCGWFYLSLRQHAFGRQKDKWNVFLRCQRLVLAESEKGQYSRSKVFLVTLGALQRVQKSSIMLDELSLSSKKPQEHTDDVIFFLGKAKNVILCHLLFQFNIRTRGRCYK